MLRSGVRCGLALFLPALFAGCASNASSEGANEQAIAQPASLVVSVEATAGPELDAAKEKLEREYLAEVRGLIQAWQPITALEGTLRIALVDSGRSDREVISEIYGPTYRADARALLSELESLAEDDDSLASWMENARCRFPGLGYPTVLHYPAIALATPRADLVGWTREALRRLDDESVPPKEVARVFGRSKATTYASAGSRCSMIVLSNPITENGFALPPRDVVLHEVGHVLDLTTRSVTSALHPNALGEALADVMSHAYSGSPCHVPAPEYPDGCMRRLDVPDADATAPEGFLPDWYAYGQPSRFAGWRLVKGKPVTASGWALLEARDQALRLPTSVPADLIYGRRPTAEEKPLILGAEHDAQETFVAALRALEPPR